MKDAVRVLKQGGVIAYPTEAVFGLGCDPFNESAVNRILEIKHRMPEKGLILIASRWEQVSNLVELPDEHLLEKVLKTWPGPVTWVFPASKSAPPWVCVGKDTIAIRVTAHAVANELCENFGGPIVSSSANLAGKTPAKSAEDVLEMFEDKVDFIVEGEVGGLDAPTPIYDVITGDVLRA